MRCYLRLPLLLVMASLAGCASEVPSSAPPQPPPVVPPSQPLMAEPIFSQTGLASFYGGAHQRKATAAGQSFDQRDFTAAHRSLAFGTVVRVTNLDNGQTVKVEINDRGPHIRGRIIDLSLAAARALDMEKNGIMRVRLEAFRADQAGRE